jgi:hypothetical protein
MLQPDGVRDAVWSDRDSRILRVASGDGFEQLERAQAGTR